MGKGNCRGRLDADDRPGGGTVAAAARGRVRGDGGSRGRGGGGGVGSGDGQWGRREDLRAVGHGDGLAEKQEVPDVGLPLRNEPQLIVDRVLVAVDLRLLPRHD